MCRLCHFVWIHCYGDHTKWHIKRFLSSLLFDSHFTHRPIFSSKRSTHTPQQQRRVDTHTQTHTIGQFGNNNKERRALINTKRYLSAFVIIISLHFCLARCLCLVTMQEGDTQASRKLATCVFVWYARAHSFARLLGPCTITHFFFSYEFFSRVVVVVILYISISNRVGFKATFNLPALLGKKFWIKQVRLKTATKQLHRTEMNHFDVWNTGPIQSSKHLMPNDIQMSGYNKLITMKKKK